MQQRRPGHPERGPGDSDGATARPYSTAALGLASTGVFLALLSFSFLNWFRDGTGFFAGAGSNSTFGDIRKQIDSIKAQASASGISSHVSFQGSDPYFHWLGWTLLVLSAAATGAAMSRLAEGRWWLRWVAAVVAVAGAAFTLLALNIVVFEGNAANNANAPSYGDFIGHSGAGAWAALAGFALLLVAALVPRPE